MTTDNTTTPARASGTVAALVVQVPGLRSALCALSFYHARHGTRARFRSGRRARAGLVVPVDTRRMVQLVRLHVRQAREAGFRGSVVETIMHNSPLTGGQSPRGGVSC